MARIFAVIVNTKNKSCISEFIKFIENLDIDDKFYYYRQDLVKVPPRAINNVCLLNANKYDEKFDWMYAINHTKIVLENEDNECNKYIFVCFDKEINHPDVINFKGELNVENYAK